MKNTPIITVTCSRDLPLLELQAQGIFHYLDKACPIYIIVNESNPIEWLEKFDKTIRHYYANHKLKILFRDAFPGEWWQWIPSKINPWHVGWETQQILKLAVAKHLDSEAFLICDSQNFLIKEWSADYELPKDTIPYRTGRFSMPVEIWEQYSKALDVELSPPTDQTISMCTPMFMHTQLVQGLLTTKGGVEGFSQWFKNASRIKSEFILYTIWAEKHGGINRLHQKVADWGGPYLRDSKTFSEDFEKFIQFVGVVPSHAWVSVNHRSWGDMDDDQYNRLKVKLLEYNLNPKFDEYRSTYIDYKF